MRALVVAILLLAAPAFAGNDAACARAHAEFLLQMRAAAACIEDVSCRTIESDKARLLRVEARLIAACEVPPPQPPELEEETHS